VVHFSADTRYKLYVNGKHVAVGPTRSSPLIWYYDTLDIAPYLKEGQNEIGFVVVRYFVALRSAMPFVRTALPGLTVIGKIETGQDVTDVASSNNWMASVDESIQFPMGLADDVFLHVRLALDRSSPHEFH
jgi:Alpha-L-rhamnosidase N-terminal domain.